MKNNQKGLGGSNAFGHAVADSGRATLSTKIRRLAKCGSGALLKMLEYRAGREFPTPLTDDARLEGMAVAEASGARDVMVLGQLLGVCSPAVSEGGFDIRPYFATEAVGPQHPVNADDVERVDSWLRDADLVANAVARDVAFSVALGWAVDFDLVDKGREWLDLWKSHDGVSDWHLLYYGVLLGVVNPVDVQEELFAAAGDCADRVLLSVAALVDAYRACGECGLALALVPVAERSVGGVVVVESLQRVVNAYGPLAWAKAPHTFLLARLLFKVVDRVLDLAPDQTCRILGLAGGLLIWAWQTTYVILVSQAALDRAQPDDQLAQAWAVEVNGSLAAAYGSIGQQQATHHANIATTGGSGNSTAWLVQCRHLQSSGPSHAQALAAAQRSLELTLAQNDYVAAFQLADLEVELTYHEKGIDECNLCVAAWYERASAVSDQGLKEYLGIYTSLLEALPFRYDDDFGAALPLATRGLELAKRIGTSTDIINTVVAVGSLYALDDDYQTAVRIYESGLKAAQQVRRPLAAHFADQLATVYSKVGRREEAYDLCLQYEIEY